MAAPASQPGTGDVVPTGAADVVFIERRSAGLRSCVYTRAYGQGWPVPRGDVMHDQTLALDAGPIAPAASSPQRTFPDQPFEFRGSGSEYFRIWIVNFALSIVTLGI